MMKATWTYKGFTCEMRGTSHSCPSLTLYGYYDDTRLHRAIDRRLKEIAETEHERLMNGE